MKIRDIASVMEEMTPLGLAQDWDNVGLLVGDPQARVKSILLTIDVTREVVAEAKRLKAELIVSYHPVIWDGLKSVTAEGKGHVVYDLIRNEIGVFSIHTALDTAIGGVNDGLAEIVGIEDGEPIGDYVDYPVNESYKLIVFVPVDAAAKVSNAIFAAGAGAMGNYRNCSFQAEGTGTFLPLAGARPAMGKRGKLEKVPEVRFEAVIGEDGLQHAIAAMKEAHPYETPAFDVVRLYNNRNRFGLGRIGRLATPLRVKQIVQRIKKYTGAKAFGMIGDERRLVETAAVCAGSCGKIINSVIAAKTDLYLTGELKHHQALAAQEAGLTCICLSHTVSERFILKKLSKQLQKRTKQVTIRISKKDADPFKWKNV
ncbi:MAG: Nif3-like dinuclear metal center hexameric protein [Phycisphaerales bacterium]|nr:MAG: Nif3-like dinuclear metal center hexameric protein [Phycisphaerales bacterium]